MFVYFALVQYCLIYVLYNIVTSFRYDLMVAD